MELSGPYDESSGQYQYICSWYYDIQGYDMTCDQYLSRKMNTDSGTVAAKMHTWTAQLGRVH
jgi:hypothetical protein